MIAKHFSYQYFWAKSPSGCQAILHKNIGWKAPVGYLAFFSPISLEQIT